MGKNASSGYAAVIVGENEEVVSSSWIPRSGNNYNAELAAVVAALTSCPNLPTSRYSVTVSPEFRP